MNYSSALVAKTNLLEAASSATRHAEHRFHAEKEIHELTPSEPFFVDPHINHIMTAAASAVPPWPIRATDLIVPAAFWWFPEHLHLRAHAVPIAAFNWLLVPPIAEEAEVLRLAQKYNFGADRDRVHQFATRGFVTFRFWEEFQPGRLRACHWAAQIIGESRPETTTAIIRPAAQLELWRLVLSAIAFCRQRVLIPDRLLADRASRRQAERRAMSTDREVAVIRLRYASSGPSASSDSASIEWSCRWWVAGHWRQQPCGEGRNERRPTWISPYLKGPEDRPIKTAPRVFAVVR